MKSCPECAATYPDDYAICPKDGAPLHETSLWQIGTVVRGKYRIKARLGEGGMATVYKAHHELLDEMRALKVIKPELARDPEFMGRFKNEAIMARKLNHPNAVRVDDLDIAEDGLPFIAMELVVGDTLKTLLQRTGPLPVSLVLDVAGHVCDALDAAHKLGLIHRDIKPENIVLVAQREGPPIAKILDFGISRLRQETTGVKGLTQTGMVIGTPEYMSPEQAIGKRGDELDGRSDLYSLGIVMYRMLTGELPFVVETTVEMILQHLRTPPIPPHLLKSELAIPENVSSIVMKALEKDPNKRYATGAEMAAAIKLARGSTTRPSHKIDWKAVSSAAASFGADTEAPSPPPARSPATITRSVPVDSPAPAAAPREKTLYRTSARIAPPPRAISTRLVLILATAAVLIVGTFVAWKHTGRGNPEKSATDAPAATITPPPAKTAEPSAPGKNKMKNANKAGPAPRDSDGQRPPQRKDLTYAEQAKIIELNTRADSYYREGGCEKALPPYQQVLEIDPGNPQAYTAVQKCYAKARNAGKSIPIPGLTPTNPPNP
ncbi:MAG: protein kinase domain-containing protein [Terriglobia bacterium]